MHYIRNFITFISIRIETYAVICYAVAICIERIKTIERIDVLLLKIKIDNVN